MFSENVTNVDSCCFHTYISIYYEFYQFCVNICKLSNISINYIISLSYTIGFVTVASDPLHTVTMVNKDNIKLGQFAERLRITWLTVYFNATVVDIDFVIFR